MERRGRWNISYGPSQRLFPALTSLPFCRANHLPEPHCLPPPPQCISNQSKRNALPQELMGLLTPQGLPPLWAFVGRDTARQGLMVPGSRAARDDFLSSKGWCPREEPLQGVPTSHSSPNGEGSPCALIPFHPRATPFSFGSLGSVRRGKEHVEASLECSRTLISQKRKTNSVQVTSAVQGAPEAAKSLRSLAMEMFLHDIQLPAPWRERSPDGPHQAGLGGPL